MDCFVTNIFLFLLPVTYFTLITFKLPILHTFTLFAIIHAHKDHYQGPMNVIIQSLPLYEGLYEDLSTRSRQY